MKKILIFLLLFIVSRHASADIIYSPIDNGTPALSLEMIGSYEFRISDYTSISLWAGGGAVSPLSAISHPAFGIESAAELRLYLNDKKFHKFNVGLYAGVAGMRVPYMYNGRLVRREPSVGIVPGLKLTYKHRFNEWLVGEPYIGISTPWYGDTFKEAADWMKKSDPSLVLTLGFRVGFNKIHPGKKVSD